jgi:hypothetical protein
VGILLAIELSLLVPVVEDGTLLDTYHKVAVTVAEL